MLVLLKNSVQWDSRVKKIIKTFRKFGVETQLLSVESTLDIYEIENLGKVDFVFHHSKRMIVPGLSLMFLNIKFIRAAICLHTRGRPIYCNDLNTLLTGCMLKILFRSKLIYDTHEYAADEVVDGSAWKKNLIMFYQKLLLNLVDQVVTVSPLIAQQLKADYPFISDPIVVKNLPDLSPTQFDTFNIYTEYNIDEAAIVIVYHGNISTDYVVDALVKTFARMNSKNIEFLILGLGTKFQELLSKSKEFDHVKIRTAVSQDRLYTILNNCDFGLVIYPPGCLNHEYCFPNKYFDYVACGVVPIIPDLQQLKQHISETGFGVMAHQVKSYEDLDKLRSKMKKTYINSGLRVSVLWDVSERVIEEQLLHYTV